MAGPEPSQPKWEGPVEGRPLDSARGKLVRGFQQTQFLVRHCEAYAASEPVKLTVRFDEGSESHIAFMEGRRPPLYLGLILAGRSKAHELASSTDFVGGSPNDAQGVTPFVPCDASDHCSVARLTEPMQRLVIRIDDDDPELLHPDPAA